jgi:hypothetical protein
MFIGELASTLLSRSLPEIDESPHAYHDSHKAVAPVGVFVMYAGWQPASNFAERAHLKFIVYNGLSEPITYHGFSDLEAAPVIFINGEAVFRSRCSFGTRDYVLHPGTATEFHINSDELGRRPDAGSQIIVGLNLYLRNSKKPSIQAASEPFQIPESFRLGIPSPN